MTRVCRDCNSFLGSKIDTGLTEFEPILWKRGEFGLAGNSGTPPSPASMIEGIAMLVCDPERRVKLKYNKASKKLKMEAIHHRRELELDDGKKVVQFVVDFDNKADIPKIVQRERKRHGMMPLTEEEMADFMETLEVQQIEKPEVTIDQTISFAYLRHAMLKIVYELAFLWLGESYLEDPQAYQFRRAIIGEPPRSGVTPDSASEINGYAWLIRELSAFSAWEIHPAHHLAFADQHGDQILISVRIFDLLEAVFPVTKDATRYLTAGKFEHDLPFLAMDSLSGKMYKSRFFEETMRLTFMERIYLRGLPFPDPLATDHVVSSLDPSGGFTYIGLPWQWGTNWQWWD